MQRKNFERSRKVSLGRLFAQRCHNHNVRCCLRSISWLLTDSCVQRRAYVELTIKKSLYFTAVFFAIKVFRHCTFVVTFLQFWHRTAKRITRLTRSIVSLTIVRRFFLIDNRYLLKTEFFEKREPVQKKSS